jgi:hypothetical protein
MFPTSQPEGAAPAHVELDKTVGAVPTWSIQTLNAGPPRSSSGYSQHVRDTVRSSYDWSDEIRFDDSDTQELELGDALPAGKPASRAVQAA